MPKTTPKPGLQEERDSDRCGLPPLPNQPRPKPFDPFKGFFEGGVMEHGERDEYGEYAWETKDL